MINHVEFQMIPKELNNKLQITNKSQIQNPNDQNWFCILNLIIVIYL